MCPSLSVPEVLGDAGRLGGALVEALQLVHVGLGHAGPRVHRVPLGCFLKMKEGIHYE